VTAILEERMATEIPQSMEQEFRQWNDGDGISLETWAECSGNYALAVGYAALFWPEFKVFGKYILHEYLPTESVTQWETESHLTPGQIEAMLNHIHLSDLHPGDERNLTADKLIFIGNRLKEIYKAKLAWLYPDRPCEVHFSIPENPDDYRGYELTFWQKIWDE
ncbi:MAG: hypothetical protein AAFX96_07060, partial [Pseudomonadota bacterium]